VLRRGIIGTALLAALMGCTAKAEDEDKDAKAEVEEVEPEAAPEPLPENFETQVVEYLGQYGRNWPSFGFHGVVLVARGDDVAMHRAFGSADLSNELANETSTRFRIGTLSAQLVAAAVMILSERGKLSLTDPVSRFVPHYPKGDQITVEHLLTHSSGIPNFTDSQWFEHNKATPKSVGDLVAAFQNAPLEHEPGAEITPSNSNYVLAAAIVEKAAGTGFEPFIQKEILDKLEMSETEFGTTESPQAVGLQFNEKEHLDPVYGVHPAAFGPAGGYISTVGDLLALNRGLAQGKLMSETARDQMMGLLESDVGYGWVTHQQWGRRMSGWPGLIDGINSSVMNSVDDETVVVVFANTEVVSAGQIAQDIMGMAYGAEAPTYEEHREVPVPLVEQASAAGHYVITRKTEKLIEAVDPERLDNLAEIDVVVLEGSYLALDVPVHGRKRMHPLGKGRFFFKDLPRTTARFTRKSDGKGRLVLEQPGGAELVFLRKGPPAPLPAAVASR